MFDFIFQNFTLGKGRGHLVLGDLLAVALGRQLLRLRDRQLAFYVPAAEFRLKKFIKKISRILRDFTLRTRTFKADKVEA